MKKITKLVLGCLLLLLIGGINSTGFAQTITNGGFETGSISPWVGSSVVSVSTGFTELSWTIVPSGTGMARIEPTSDLLKPTAEANLGLSSGALVAYNSSIFSHATNFGTMTQTITLEAGETIVAYWNYVSRDYDPYNDGVMATLVGPSYEQIKVLGMSVNAFGTGAIVTGSYGSTGWFPVTFTAGAAGTYTLGFACWNADDQAVLPILCVDNAAGGTSAPGSPVVTTSAISATSCTSATCGGNVTSDGGGFVTAKGVCWNTTGAATISGSHTNDGTGTGSFTSTMTGLTPAVYYVRTYATNTAGTSYGPEVTLDLTGPSAGTLSGASSVCAGSTTTFSSTASGGSWSSSNTAIATVDGSTGVVSGVSAGSCTISYTVSNSCGTSTATRNILVIALPSAGTVSGASTVCVGSSTSFTSTGTGGSWSSSNPTVASVTSTGSVTGGSAGVATISYTATTGCGTASATQAITVNPLPNAGTLSGASTVCASATTTFSSTVSGGSWSSSNTGVATVGSTGVVTGVAAGSAIISYTSTTACGTDVATMGITVIALPTAGTISGTANICNGSSTSLSSTVGGGSWSSSNPSVASVTSTGMVTGASAGTSTISYTVSSSCGSASATVVVTVGAIPGITGATSVCVGSSTTLSGSGSGVSWSSSNPSVATIGSTSGLVSGISVGSTTITFTASGATACSNTFDLFVNPTPATPSGPSTVCVGSTVDWTTDLSCGTWSSSNTSIATVSSIPTGPSTAIFSGSTTTITGVTGGSCTITFTSCDGCMTTRTISVNPLPAAITGSTVICVGSTTTLSSTTTGGSWSSSNPDFATVSGGLVTGVAGGVVTISYTNSFGCSRTVDVTVNDAPAAIGGSSSVCVGATTTLTHPVSGGTWSSSSTTTATVSGSGVVTGVAAGSVTITYMLSAGCFTTTSIVVNPLPNTISGASAVCAGSTTTLSTTSTGGTWMSGSTGIATVDGSTGIVTGVTAGAVSISYVLSTGCYRPKAVTVNPLPAAIAGTLSVCQGSTTTLSSTTGGGVSWTSDNTSVATVGFSTGIVNGVAAGSANITYTISTGCQVSANVVVNPAAGAISGGNTVCVGSATTLSTSSSCGSWTSSNTAIATVGTGGSVTGVMGGMATITFTTCDGCRATYAVTVYSLPAAITGATTVCVGSTSTLSTTTTGGSWSSSNTDMATVGTGGIVTGIGAGTAEISYTSAAGCSRVTTVIVTSAPSAISGPTDMCIGQGIALTHSTSGGTWSSSNTSIAIVTAGGGVVTGVATGSANITYTLSAGCITVKSISVNTLPSTITGTFSICAGMTTTLSDATSGTWSSSNTTAATIDGSTGLVTALTAGTTTITLMAGTGCYKTQTFTVLALPAAIGGTASVCEGATTSLTDATGGGVSWTSSATSTATVSGSGIVTGVAAGIATITYTVSSGCYATKDVTVNAVPSAITGSTFMCNGTGSSLSSTPSGGSWTSSNTAIATVGTDGTVGSVAPGYANITYTVSGCRAIAAITVGAVPAVITGVTSVCPGGTTTLSSATGSCTWSSASPSVATIGTSGIVTGVSPGAAVISYTHPLGCVRTTTVTVTSGPGANTGTASACVGSTTTLSNATSGGTWSSSNTATATVVSGTGVVTGVSGGMCNITYTLSGGCRAITEVTINSSLAAIGGTASVCEGGNTTLTHAVGGGTWSSSNTTAATIGSSSGIVNGLTAGTSTIVYNVSGCTVSVVLTVNAGASAIGGTLSTCEGSTTTLTNTGGGTWSSNTPGVATIGSSSGIVTGVLAGTSVITYMLTSGCYSTATVTITSGADPITGTLFLCNGSTTSLSSGPSGGAWSSGATGIATVGTDGVVTGHGAGYVNITYTAGGCSSVAAVTVGAVPAVITGNSAGICPGATLNLTSATPGCTWSSSTPAVATIGSTGSTTATVTGVSTGTTTISYIHALGCYTTTVVTINSAPTAITGTLTLCGGSASTLASTPSGGAWTSSATGVATITSLGVMTGGTAGTTTISYTAGGCRVTAVATVSAALAAITGTTNVCVGNSITLSHAVSGGTWTSSNITQATVGSGTGIVTGVAAGSPKITYSINPTCYVTKAVTVNGGTGAITGNVPVCVGSTVTLTNILNGGIGSTWSVTSTSIATVGATSGVITGIAAGNTGITYNGAGGCTSTSVVTVIPLPATITGTATVCQGATTTLASTDAGGTWMSSNTSKAIVGSSTGVVTGVNLSVIPPSTLTAATYAVGTSTITYTWTNGCKRTQVVTVNPFANPGTVQCAGSTILHTAGPDSRTLTASNNTGGTATSGGTWTTSNANVSLVPSGLTSVVTAASAGAVNVTYTVTNGCGTTFSKLTLSVVAPKAGAPIATGAGSDVRFSVYPNPTSGTVTVEAPVTGVFNVYTIDSRLVSNTTIKEATTSITLPSSLPNGIYMCRFNGDDGSVQIVRMVLEGR